MQPQLWAPLDKPFPNQLGLSFHHQGPSNLVWPHCRISPRGSHLLCRPMSPTWNLYISPLRMLLSTVPPKMYMASEITAAAWKSLPLGSWVERGTSH